MWSILSSSPFDWFNLVSLVATLTKVLQHKKANRNSLHVKTPPSCYTGITIYHNAFSSLLSKTRFSPLLHWSPSIIRGGIKVGRGNFPPLKALKKHRLVDSVITVSHSNSNHRKCLARVRLVAGSFNTDWHTLKLEVDWHTQFCSYCSCCQTFRLQKTKSKKNMALVVLYYYCFTHRLLCQLPPPVQQCASCVLQTSSTQQTGRNMGVA